jgi:prepilin-type processing-associated H-X9-DG protein/prepilin-type N-terminal cleavage/methylation domain-containing protein
MQKVLPGTATKSSANARPRVHAFTLVEILVVIGILALLAAILFPVFAQVRAKGRQSTCVSNLKQLSAGLQMYRQDYDEAFPYWDWDKSSRTGTVTPNRVESLWFNAMYSRVNNSNVFMCPSASDQRTLRETDVFGWVDPDKFEDSGVVGPLRDKPVSYGMSEMLSKGTACRDKGNGPCTDGGLDRPAESLLLADCSQGLTNDLGERPDRSNSSDPRHQFLITRVAFANAPEDCYVNPLRCGAARAGTLASFGASAAEYRRQVRHQTGSNIVFADGHAKWLPLEAIVYDLFAGDGHP